MRYSILICFLFSFFTASSQRNPRGIEVNWKTDTTNVSLDLEEIFVCLAKDEIPAIDQPTYYNVPAAEAEYFEFEPLIFVENGLKAKGYPLSILLYHEIVNDSIVGEDSTLYYSVTYCPLCNSAIVFNRQHKVNGETVLLDFGVSGMLRNSDMVMYDRQTESWWQQLTGEGLAGEMNGQKLDFITAPVISIEEFALFFPDGQVLSKNNGLVNKDGTQKNYDTNPYQGYDSDDTPFLFDGKIDERLPPMERVVDIIIHGQHKIYPNTALFEEKVINDKFEGEHITLFSTHKIISVLDSTEIKKSRTVGGVAAYYSDLDGKTLTFTAKEEGLFTDDQTKSVWNVKGQCIQGKLKGNRLRMIVHGNHFAFAMLAFYPNCQIFGLD